MSDILGNYSHAYSVTQRCSGTRGGKRSPLSHRTHQSTTPQHETPLDVMFPPRRSRLALLEPPDVEPSNIFF